LGDFFDYWCGDDDDNQFITTMKNNLAKFCKLTPIFFIHGNHDFTIGKRFAKETGIQLIKDLSVLNVNEQNILLSHGDVFCTADIKYQKYKKTIRNPIILTILLHLPLKLRYWLKNKFNQASNKHFDIKLQEMYQVVDNTILNYAKQYNTLSVIHGHTHNPGVYSVKDSKVIRYEIPDWDIHNPGGYILLTDSKIEIIYAKEGK
jgi:UDP-2,3-diacylglucosamine hydrolase